MNVTIGHLMKHLSEKLKKGNYGSVLIHIRDGVITGVKDNIEWNADSFVEFVENAQKPITRYVVKNKKNEMPENDVKIDTIEVMIIPTESINAKKLHNDAIILPDEKE